MVVAAQAGARPAPLRCCSRRGGGGGRLVVCTAAVPEPGNTGGGQEQQAAAGGEKRGEGRRVEPLASQRQRPSERDGWRWQARGGRAEPLQRLPPQQPQQQQLQKQQQQQQHQQQQQGVWTAQPRPASPGLDGGGNQRTWQAVPGTAQPPRRPYSGSSLGSEEEDEGSRQRRVQRQHTLRSLRQDLSATQVGQRQQQQQLQSGRPASTAAAPGLASLQSGDADSDVDSDWAPPQGSGGSSDGRASSRSGQAGTRERERSDRAPRLDSVVLGLAGVRRDPQGMLPRGYFLNVLQDVGAVGPDGRPTEQGLRQGVGSSTFMNVCINKLLSHCADSGTVLSIVRDAGDLVDSINTATAVHRLGKVVRRRREAQPGLLQAVLRHPQYRQLVGRVAELAPTYRPRGLANTLWGLAALGDAENAALARTLAEAVARFPVDEFRPQELSNIVWALGTLGVLCEPALDHVLQGVVRQIKAHPTGPEAFIPQALSNMVWACAHLRNGTRGCGGPSPGGGPPTTVRKDNRPGWAPAPAFLEAVAHVAALRMQDFQSQTLSNLLWGYCKLDVYPQELFEAAAGELVERFRTPELARQFCAQELSNSLYAFAQGNIIDEQLLSAYERELSATWVELDGSGRERRVSRLDDFTSQALANTLWSFANLRWYPVQLLEPITRAVGRKMHSMSTQEISNSIWSYAKFAYHPGPVMVQYQAEIGRRVQQFDGQSLTTTLWAMAALSATHCEGFVRLVDRFVELERQGAFQDVQYNQVLQAVLLAQFEMQGRPGETRADINLPDDIVDRALLAWQQQQQAAKLSSFQLEVSDALGALGIEHELEHLTAKDLLSVDIAIVKGDKRIAVEVDGPFHFSVNTNSPLGQTMIRRRLLRAVGWTVISVPYHTWYKLPIESRRAYMSRLLVRKDGSFHDQLMQVSDDLLSTEFKKGLGSEVGVDEDMGEAEMVEGSSAATGVEAMVEAEEGEKGGTVRLLPGPQWGQKRRYAARNLEKLLDRRGLMFTKSAAKRLMDWGLVEQVAAGEGEGQDPTAMVYARRQGPDAGGGSNGAARASSSSGEAFGGAAASEQGGGSLDALLEAACSGAGGANGTEQAPGSEQEVEAPLRLNVDEVDLENPLRPRYTDFAGNVLSEGNEPFNLALINVTAMPSPRRATPPPLPPTALAPSSGATGSMPPPPARRNPLAQQLTSQQQQQPIGRQRRQQQQQPNAPPLQKAADADEHPGQPGGGGQATAPAARAVPRPVRPAPPLPQRHDPRPWQLTTAADQATTAIVGAGTAPTRPPHPGTGPVRGQQALHRSSPGQLEGPVEPGSHVVQLASRLSLAELRRLCDGKGLPTYGTKAQLAGRLVAAQQSGQQT